MPRPSYLLFGTNLQSTKNTSPAMLLLFLMTVALAALFSSMFTFDLGDTYAVGTRSWVYHVGQEVNSLFAYALGIPVRNNAIPYAILTAPPPSGPYSSAMPRPTATHVPISENNAVLRVTALTKPASTPYPILLVVITTAVALLLFLPCHAKYWASAIDTIPSFSYKAISLLKESLRLSGYVMEISFRLWLRVTRLGAAEETIRSLELQLRNNQIKLTISQTSQSEVRSDTQNSEQEYEMLLHLYYAQLFPESETNWRETLEGKVKDYDHLKQKHGGLVRTHKRLKQHAGELKKKNQKLMTQDEINTKICDRINQLESRQSQEMKALKSKLAMFKRDNGQKVKRLSNTLRKEESKVRSLRRKLKSKATSAGGDSRSPQEAETLTADIQVKKQDFTRDNQEGNSTSRLDNGVEKLPNAGESSETLDTDDHPQPQSGGLSPFESSKTLKTKFPTEVAEDLQDLSPANGGMPSTVSHIFTTPSFVDSGASHKATVPSGACKTQAEALHDEIPSIARPIEAKPKLLNQAVRTTREVLTRQYSVNPLYLPNKSDQEFLEQAARTPLPKKSERKVLKRAALFHPSLAPKATHSSMDSGVEGHPGQSPVKDSYHTNEAMPDTELDAPTNPIPSSTNPVIHLPAGNTNKADKEDHGKNPYHTDEEMPDAQPEAPANPMPSLTSPVVHLPGNKAEEEDDEMPEAGYESENEEMTDASSTPEDSDVDMSDADDGGRVSNHQNTSEVTMSGTEEGNAATSTSQVPSISGPSPLVNSQIPSFGVSWAPVPRVQASQPLAASFASQTGWPLAGNFTTSPNGSNSSVVFQPSHPVVVQQPYPTNIPNPSLDNSVPPSSIPKTSRLPTNTSIGSQQGPNSKDSTSNPTGSSSTDFSGPNVKDSDNKIPESTESLEEDTEEMFEDVMDRSAFVRGPQQNDSGVQGSSVQGQIPSTDSGNLELHYRGSGRNMTPMIPTPGTVLLPGLGQGDSFDAPEVGNGGNSGSSEIDAAAEATRLDEYHRVNSGQAAWVDGECRPIVKAKSRKRKPVAADFF